MVTETKQRIARIVFGAYLVGVLTITFIVRETMVLRMPDNRGVVLEPLREVEARLCEKISVNSKTVIKNDI